MTRLRTNVEGCLCLCACLLLLSCDDKEGTTQGGPADVVEEAGDDGASGDIAEGPLTGTQTLGVATDHFESSSYRLDFSLAAPFTTPPASSARFDTLPEISAPTRETP